jgi:hypothetical protein
VGKRGQNRAISPSCSYVATERKRREKEAKKRIINIGDFAHFAHWKPTLEARGKEPAKRPAVGF